MLPKLIAANADLDGVGWLGDAPDKRGDTLLTQAVYAIQPEVVDMLTGDPATTGILGKHHAGRREE